MIEQTCAWAKHRGYTIKVYNNVLVVFQTCVSTGVYNALTNRLTFHRYDAFNLDLTKRKCLLTNLEDCLFC